jgi:plasmid stabilization system protein ParE
MRFTVIWRRRAQGELADVWTDSPDRQAVSDAADRIDRILRIDPHLKGRPFDGDRILVEEPLAVVFSVNPGDRKVEVLAVWHL